MRDLLTADRKYGEAGIRGGGCTARSFREPETEERSRRRDGELDSTVREIDNGYRETR